MLQVAPVFFTQFLYSGLAGCAYHKHNPFYNPDDKDGDDFGEVGVEPLRVMPCLVC